jgi:hypothetical protein
MLASIYQQYAYKCALEKCVYNARVFELPPRNKLVHINDYVYAHYFHKVADILPDYGKGVQDIKPVPLNKKEFSQEQEWIYLIVVNGYIVKIGGTRTGISKRWNSYACGHYCTERGNSGKCSETNANVYNTLCAFIRQRGWKVELYGHPVESVKHKLHVFGEEVEAPVQTYHVYESKILGDFEREYGSMPYLSLNSDPNYRH